MLPSRKYYKYAELPQILDCSFEDLEDYVYRQHIIKPSLEYKGLAVNAKVPNRIPPKQIDGNFEVDMSTLKGHNTVGSADLYYTTVNRIYIEGVLYQLIHIGQNKFLSHKPKYRNPYMQDNNIQFNAEPENLTFLKSTIDKLLEKEAPPALEPTLVNKEDSQADKITATKKVIKAQGFANRSQLALILGKSKQTLSNRANDHNSGWDSIKKNYTVAAIEKFYDINFSENK